MTVLNIITIILCAAGILFMLFALTGIVRFPDFYTRLHAQGIGDTLGAFLIMLGMVLTIGLHLMSLKVLLIFIIIVLTNPLGTNLMMIAAVRRDDYQEYNSKTTEDTDK